MAHHCYTMQASFEKYSLPANLADYQAAAGIFYTLPLGLRVQEKLCRLADEAMKRVGKALSMQWS
jgi:prolyl-tRNA synthetase